VRVLALLLGIAVLTSAACPAAARDDEDDCQSQTAPPGQIIAACTRLLAAGGSREYRHTAFYNRALALQAEHHERKAIGDYSSAIGLDPNDSDSYTNRGSCYQHLGQFESALADFDRALTLNADDDLAHLDRASVLQSLHQESRALDDLNAAIRLRPNDGDVYAARARTHELLGNDAASIDDATQALALHGGDADTLRFHRGLSEFRIGRLIAARTDFAQLVDQVPVSDFAGIATAWLYASDHLLHVDDRAQFLARAAGLGSTWPSAILRYLAGRATREDLLRGARSGEQLCDARFALAMVTISARGPARDELDALRSDCPPAADR